MSTPARNNIAGHLIGLLFIASIAAIGISVVMAGLGRFGRSAGDAPGWVLIAAGGGFLLAAASFALSAIGGIVYGATAKKDGSLSDEAPIAIRATQIVLSLGIVAMLATVSTWVALNPEPDASTSRKFAFAAGAVTIWVMFAGIAIFRLRRLLR
jgi:hypothetical protein